MKNLDLEGVCAELRISMHHIEGGFCEFLDSTGLDWEDLENLETLPCLENVTELVLDDQLVECPADIDFYSVLHDYMWTLKVIVTGIDIYEDDPKSKAYIMEMCPLLHSAVFEFFTTLGGNEDDTQECDYDVWMAECGFQWPPSIDAREQRIDNLIFVRYLMEVVQVSLDCICPTSFKGIVQPFMSSNPCVS